MSEESNFVDFCAGQEFKHGMRQLPGAVCIVATAYKEKRTGLTLTAVCSVSADPPSLLVCVNREASAHDLIMKSGCFSVNQLSSDQEEYAQIFAGQRGIDGSLRFSKGNWSSLKTGAPILTDAVASFDCKVFHTTSLKTHTIFVGFVLAAQFDEAWHPLGYFRGNYCHVEPRSAS